MKLKFVAILSSLFLLVSLCACAKSIADQVTSLAKAEGYEVSNNKTGVSNVELLIKDDNGLYINYYEFPDNDSAKKYYEELTKGKSDSLYTDKSNGKYTHIRLKDNSIMYAVVDIANEDKVVDFASKLGYN